MDPPAELGVDGPDDLGIEGPLGPGVEGPLGPGVEGPDPVGVDGPGVGTPPAGGLGLCGGFGRVGCAPPGFRGGGGGKRYPPPCALRLVTKTGTDNAMDRKRESLLMTEP